jgi:molybdate transport system substrate-binding protein
VLDYVARDEVDAGIVYMTDALVMKEKVAVVEKAPEASHKPVMYPIAVIKSTNNEPLAREFEKAVTSDQARTIFEKYGFKKVAP